MSGLRKSHDDDEHHHMIIIDDSSQESEEEEEEEEEEESGWEMDYQQHQLDSLLVRPLFSFFSFLLFSFLID